MTIGELKKLIEPMDDNGLVLARDRDSINLEMVDIVGHPSFSGRIGNVYFRKEWDEVYGGDDAPEEWKNQSAIIFCDND